MVRFSARRAVLSCEHLEGRDCPAIFVFGGIMTIIGTSGADVVEVTDDGAGNVTATLNGTTRTASGIRAVAAATFGGDDSITYTLTGEQSGRRAVLVDAGSGNDTVTLEAGDVAGQFAFAAYGGGGDDTLSATVGGVAEDAVAAVALDGGWGDDDITGTAAGEIDGYLAVALSGGIGADAITGEIDVAADSTGTVAALVDGGPGDDDLTLNVTGDGLDGLARLIAIMNGGRGTDTGVATDNVTKISIEA